MSNRWLFRPAKVAIIISYDLNQNDCFTCLIIQSFLGRGGHIGSFRECLFAHFSDMTKRFSPCDMRNKKKCNRSVVKT